ncbi:hypothetical protein FOS14_09815 [Skermania sp. ID1734]|uniref:hypothetical protein n=1 Tax=Skermania sp. ID1734 TaxID=2597516 RepID=UPI00117DC7F9|nr:hypothetical protein [Skermania sp. ID1734]TSE00099.1 hypothetical protein FOS14_09815 [Skermania sp. ID1734]
MNHLTRAITVSAAVLTAAASAGGTAVAAESAAASPSTTLSLDLAPGVHYTADSSDASALLQTAFGTLTTRGGQFQILDNTSRLVAGTDLTVNTDPKSWPKATHTESSAATMASEPHQSITPASAAGLPLHAADATDDFNDALSVASTQFGLATGVGTLAGGAIGLVAGCPIGAVTLGLTAIPTGPVAPLIAGLGCVVGAGTGAGIGSLVGAIALGVPVGIASGVQMYNTLHAQGNI